ncbi:protein Z, vitamin K-dependent plasma glycoprotein b isoform X1 [Syngnathus scovelli]|uniref:protein Z, vitamin K-dependent plasma glycoprotein b isoform X1 n=1 Tax=Syngnathus scovelli TaxID=161590 RepID=UPI00210F2C43|nr:protein Z, vitamin K-dependent plasma glycoprotein b isoform X1 [Syngnathus scovelli]
MEERVLPRTAQELRNRDVTTLVEHSVSWRYLECVFSRSTCWHASFRSSEKQTCFYMRRLHKVFSCVPSERISSLWRSSCRATWNGNVTRNVAPTRRPGNTLKTRTKRSAQTVGQQYFSLRLFNKFVSPQDKFWDTYPNKDECKPNPCLHGGNCTKKAFGFHCSCSPPHHGITCQLKDSQENKRTPKLAPQVEAGGFPCPTEGPNVCHQLCTSTTYAFTCSCVAGFKLHSDGRSCLPEGDFPCGRLSISPQRASMCHHGNCPWQALLLGSGGTELCAGVLLGPRAVLTSASCLLQEPDPQPSNFFVIAGATDKTMSVKAIHLHKRFVRNRHDNDLAFLELSGPLPLGSFLRHLCLPTKDFSENILMYSGRTALAASMNQHLDQKLIYLSLDECRGRLNVSLDLSNKMFCVMGRTGKTVMQSTKTVSSDGLRSTAPQCGGGLLSAMPLATVERGTAFLTGLLIVPPKGCQENGLVFTKVSRHLVWIRQHLEAVQSHDQTT